MRWQRRAMPITALDELASQFRREELEAGKVEAEATTSTFKHAIPFDVMHPESPKVRKGGPVKKSKQSNIAHLTLNTNVGSQSDVEIPPSGTVTHNHVGNDMTNSEVSSIASDEGKGIS